MMEHVDRAGQEEFIWAMRTRALMPEETEVWRERSTKGTLYEESTYKRKNENTSEVHTKILASLVPDEIIYNCNSYQHRDYEVCLLFGDVSGFTDLCEKYNQIGKGGPSRLTQVLNAYIGTMVQEIMSYNGDVLKFSGDAFLAMWRTDLNNQSLQDCVHQALDCALIIQKTHGRYETDVGVFLRVKLAIAAGQVVFSIIGEPKMSHYVVIGSPIWDVKGGEKCATAGEVIVSQSAWDYINPNEYQFDVMQDQLHIKVFGLTQNWRSTQRSIAKDEYGPDMNLSPKDSLVSITASDIEENEVFELRPSVGDAVKMNIKEDLRKYILPPIMRGIDMDEPLEYLTEMRHIVILFINIVTEKIEVHEYVNIVDQCYKIVCNIVDGMEGCVNKVSLFDKDLMFVVIFGFRGFKHELESQRGLECAMKCFHKVREVKYVKSTSAAVTTGMTYCGAVGHTLRREYTVISLTVNKAARLMVAYPNRVTCDRDTFLQSKMEGRHFILQEYKPLKGITNVGPVYEFIECDNSKSYLKTPISLYPTLDRDKEIYTYIEMLRDLIQDEDVTYESLLIYGTARQGKTRIGEEFIYITPKHVPIYRMKLISTDKHIPYQALYLMFCVPLGIKSNSTPLDRQTKLTSKLEKMPVPELICLLNEIFRVNFEKTALFYSLTTRQKTLALKKIIKQLMFRLFSKLWVVVIDDGEFIDDESWDVFDAVMNTHKLLVVITMASNNKLPYVAKTLLKCCRMKLICLNPIDKWYHAGMACQVLNVHGIPPELEKVLHMKSNGNPGWIESFLTSLVQGGAVAIKSVPLDIVDDYGLVVPPTEMMHRTRYFSDLGHLKEKSDTTFKDSNAILQDKWKIYQNSYRDSATLIESNSSKAAKAESVAAKTSEISSSSHKSSRDSKKKDSTTASPVKSVKSHTSKDDINVSIALIVAGAEISDVDSELSIDVFIMKIFDSLSSYEQLLLKCSAVIGETLPRDMLVYLMNSQQERDTALAVKKLFEIGVLGCAREEFTEIRYTNALLDGPKMLSNDVGCYCVGIVVPFSCRNIPIYAFCAYLRFKIHSFRETTYNLLTVNQKKEFHTRAVRYLEKKTRKCKKCGGGFFNKILGVRYDEGLRQKTHTVKKHVTRLAGSQSSASILENWELHSQKKSSYLISQYNRSIFESPSSAKRKSQQLKESKDFLGDFPTPYHAIQKLRYNDSLMRTFSDSDFTDCECPTILSDMYKQIREHCEATDQMEKWINATLEYSYICILSYNVPLALKLLLNGLNVLQKKYSLVVKPRENWKVPFIRAKILTLIGKGRMELGQLKAAYQSLEAALKYYGYKFPTNRGSLRVKLMECKQRLMLYCFSRLGIGTKEGYAAEFCDNLSECLSLMCNLFMELRLYNNADIAAIWCLQKALESEKDFPTLVTAFGNMIFSAIRNRKLRLLLALEIKSMLYCVRYASQIEVKDMRAISNLYASVFKARVYRCELIRAIEIGYNFNRITDSINFSNFIYSAFPLFIKVLMLKGKTLEAMQLVLQALKQCTTDTNYNGNTWCFALCICLHLETGFFLLPFRECVNYYYSETKNMAVHEEVQAERRYFTTLWLWYVRNENYEEADIWREKVPKVNIIKCENIVNLFTALYYLEGLILIMAYKMDRKMNLQIEEYFDEAESLIKKLEVHARKVKIIGPRLYHLKAFYVFTKNNSSEAFSLLNQARKMAKKSGNLYEENWINHSEMAWQQNMPPIVYNFWKDHSTDDEMSYYELDSNDTRLGFYTLEPPMFV